MNWAHPYFPIWGGGKLGVGLPHFLGAFFGPKTRFLPWNKFFFVNSPALIYRATKRHLNIFDISSSLVVAPIWKWVHLFGPGSKIVLFANFHQFQIRIFTFDLIFGPETFVLSIFWRVTAQIRIERATQICFNFLDSSTGLVLTPHESWVPFLFPDRVSILKRFFHF